LTPDFEYVLGKRTSDTFKKFEQIAVKAYLIIRKNANLFINLFSMMKCTGIPELQSVEDLDYLKSVLVLSKTEEQAADHFRQQIQRCLKLQWSTQLNWFAHNVVHR
jgi:phosphatidylinositol-4,5-bisphosphate 3-kinase